MGLRIPQLRLHTPSGRYYVTIDGKRTYLGKVQSKAEIACMKLIQELASQFQPSPTFNIPPPQPTQTVSVSYFLVADLVERYLDWFETQNRKPSCVSRILLGAEYLVTCLGEELVSELRQKHVKQLQQHLLAVTDNPKGGRAKLSRGYINRTVAIAKQIVKWGAEEELVPAEAYSRFNLVSSLKMGQGGVELERVLPPEIWHVTECLAWIPQPSHDMVKLMMLTGCRPKELCDIRRSEISTHPNEYVNVSHSKLRISARVVNGQCVWLWAPKEHKTRGKGKPRVIAIGPQAQQVLQPWLVKANGGDVFAEPRSPSPLPVKMIAEYIQRTVGRAIVVCNEWRMRGDPPLPPIPIWTPYQLRHLAATMIGEAFDESHAAASLGHSGLDSISIYCEQAVGKAAQVAAKMG